MFCPKCGIGNLVDQKVLPRVWARDRRSHVRLNRAYRVLSATDRGNGKAIEQSKTFAVHLAAGATTDPLAQAALASVTEHTTLNLESREPATVEARGNRQVDSPSSAS
jgi:hypothetical protein